MTLFYYTFFSSWFYFFFRKYSSQHFLLFFSKTYEVSHPHKATDEIIVKHHGMNTSKVHWITSDHSSWCCRRIWTICKGRTRHQRNCAIACARSGQRRKWYSGLRATSQVTDVIPSTLRLNEILRVREIKHGSDFQPSEPRRRHYPQLAANQRTAHRQVRASLQHAGLLRASRGRISLLANTSTGSAIVR